MGSGSGQKPGDAGLRGGRRAEIEALQIGFSHSVARAGLPKLLRASFQLECIAATFHGLRRMSGPRADS